MIPNNLRYTSDHEWVSVTDSGVLRVGITDYAQNSLGDIVFVQMPESGTEVTAEDAVGEVESTKSVSDVLAPVDGTVIGRNEQLDDSPELVNSDPYGDGWLYELQPADADAYEEVIGENCLTNTARRKRKLARYGQDEKLPTAHRAVSHAS
jgi:glycine cleavage system H protein